MNMNSQTVNEIWRATHKVCSLTGDGDSVIVSPNLEWTTGAKGYIPGFACARILNRLTIEETLKVVTNLVKWSAPSE